MGRPRHRQRARTARFACRSHLCSGGHAARDRVHRFARRGEFGTGSALPRSRSGARHHRQHRMLCCANVHLRSQPQGMSTLARPRRPARRKSALESLVVAALDEMKAVNVKVLDVRGLSDFADAMVVASGNSDRHVRAIAQHVVDRAREQKRRPMGVEGSRMANGCWWICRTSSYTSCCHACASSMRSSSSGNNPHHPCRRFPRLLPYRRLPSRGKKIPQVGPQLHEPLPPGPGGRAPPRSDRLL